MAQQYLHSLDAVIRLALLQKKLTASALQRPDVLAQPGFNFIHSPPISFNGKNHFNRISGWRGQLAAIPLEEFAGDGGSCSFIATTPGMILNQSIAKRRSLTYQVCTFIGSRLLRSGKRRLN